MALHAENVCELSGFSLFCAFFLGTCSLNGSVESVKAVLDGERRALFTRPAIRQQSQVLPELCMSLTLQRQVGKNLEGTSDRGKCVIYHLKLTVSHNSWCGVRTRNEQ